MSSQDEELSDDGVRGHLSLAGTQSKDPVALELVQLDRLVEAALIDPDSGAVTWTGQNL